MKSILIRPLLAAAAAIAIGAPSPTVVAAPSDGPPDATAPRHAPSATAGRIVGIEPIRARPKGSGAGAVAGGVVGGVLGNQVFGGTAATVIGAAGGAVAGNNLERNHRTEVTGYRVSVRLDNGRSRTFTESQVSGLRVGDRVRIHGGRLQR
ncbi:MAG: glycine zipper 2TM domain-containing protein [Caldimonas sp.]